jgi:enterochelin esterase-like enzyme
MPALGLALGLLLTLPPLVGAASSGRVLEGRKLRSELLGRDWAYSVYLPPGYEESERRYPVFYLLHGLDGDHTNWVRLGHAAETADALISSGEMVPAILVFPDGSDSYWIDSDPATGFGAVETAFVTELLPHVDATYRTLATRNARMIGGLSMGGYGAIRFAFEYPELFGAVAGLSPAIQRSLEKVTRLPRSPAYGVPFDRKRWEAASPFALLPGFIERSKELPLPVYLTAGDDDGLPWLLDGAMDLHLALRAAGLPSELRITDGGHSWSVWTAGLRESLRFFSKVLLASETGRPG